MRALRDFDFRYVRRSVITVTTALVVATACGGSNGATDPTDNSAQNQPPAVVITVLSGDQQQVPAGEFFPEPVRVTVRVNDQPGSQIGYTFVEPSAPNGWLSGGTADSDGIISVRPRVGSTPGPFTMTIYRSWCQGRLRSGPTLGSTAVCEGTWLRLGTVTVTGTIVGSN